MPQMGESVIEATIITWLKKEGEKVEAEEPLLEVATDKVDTEVPAIQEGIIKEFLAKEGDIVQIGSPIALLSTDGAEIDIPVNSKGNNITLENGKVAEATISVVETTVADRIQEPVLNKVVSVVASTTDRFY